MFQITFVNAIARHSNIICILIRTNKQITSIFINCIKTFYLQITWQRTLRDCKWVMASYIQEYLSDFVRNLSELIQCISLGISIWSPRRGTNTISPIRAEGCSISLRKHRMLPEDLCLDTAQTNFLLLQFFSLSFNQTIVTDNLTSN